MVSNFLSRSLNFLPFFFSSINHSFLNKKLFFLVPFHKSYVWASFLFNLGIISSWERIKYKKKNNLTLKFFLRYKNLIPVGFFLPYSFSLKKAFFLSIIVLRSFIFYRPGITLLICTSKGLLTSTECLRLNISGHVVALLV